MDCTSRLRIYRARLPRAVNTGQINAADVNYKKALTALTAAHAQQPAHLGVGLRLAMAHRGDGVYLATLNRLVDAAREFGEAIAVGERFDDKRVETRRNRAGMCSEKCRRLQTSKSKLY